MDLFILFRDKYFFKDNSVTYYGKSEFLSSKTHIFKDLHTGGYVIVTVKDSVMWNYNMNKACIFYPKNQLPECGPFYGEKDFDWVIYKLSIGYRYGASICWNKVKQDELSELNVVCMGIVALCCYSTSEEFLRDFNVESWRNKCILMAVFDGFWLTPKSMYELATKKRLKRAIRQPRNVAIFMEMYGSRAPDKIIDLYYKPGFGVGWKHQKNEMDIYSRLVNDSSYMTTESFAQ